LQSNYYISNAGEVGSINSNYHLLEFGAWSEEWGVFTKMLISKIINSNSKIKRLNNANTINSNAWIERIISGSITQDAKIKATYTKLIYMNICIRRTDQTKPYICEIINILQPTLCGVEFIDKPVLVTANSLSYTEVIETRYHQRQSLNSDYRIA
jgi:hypothetical protein